VLCFGYGQKTNGALGSFNEVSAPVCSMGMTFDAGAFLSAFPDVQEYPLYGREIITGGHPANQRKTMKIISNLADSGLLAGLPWRDFAKPLI
jgi:hypothetical protein